MLEEILQARLAVKQSMKHHKNDPTLQRILHARQLGLKLIANVTYGYTSANFSGRMPCIEVYLPLSFLFDCSMGFKKYLNFL
jgi:DNA polymerase zeta